MVLSTERQSIELADQMLQNNELSGFLPLTIQKIDDRIEYWYETDGYTSLQHFAEAKLWHPQEVQQILAAAAIACKTVEAYLLEVGGICLTEDAIFLDGEAQIGFCYGTEQNVCGVEQIKELLWFLLCHMDHKDAAQSIELYRMYHCLRRRELTMEGWRKLFDCESRDAERTENRQLRLPQPLMESKDAEVSIPLEIVNQAPPLLSGPSIGANEKGNKAEKMRGGRFWERMHLSNKKSGTDEIPIQTDIASKSHCFLRNCSELIVETSELNQSPFYIGSSRAECQLWLFDPAISRIHAKLLYEKDNWYVMDAGSVNGTRWNQIPLRKGEKRMLQPGDRLDFAGTVYIFDRIRQGGNHLDNP